MILSDRIRRYPPYESPERSALVAIPGAIEKNGVSGPRLLAVPGQSGSPRPSLQPRDYTPAVGVTVPELATQIVLVHGYTTEPWSPVVVEPDTWGRIKALYR